MINSWIVVLPPLIAIILAITTKRVLLSLSTGIIASALIACNFNILDATSLIGLRLFAVSEVGNLASWKAFWQGDVALFTFLFLFLLGILRELILHSGAAYAFGTIIMKKMKTAKSMELATLAFSSCFFIDDYFNCLTVGSIIHSFSDAFRVPRIKITMLLVALAGPLTVLLPLSSWVAVIMSYLGKAGVGLNSGAANTLIIADPYFTLLNAIPFLFYAIITVCSIWYIVLFRKSFGITKEQEIIAQKTGNVWGGKPPIASPKRDVSDVCIAKNTALDFLFPLSTLLILVFSGICYTGNCWICGGDNTFLATFQCAKFFSSFFVGALFTVLITLLFYLSRSRLTFTKSFAAIHEGISSTISSILTLLVIWTLCTILEKDLGTGAYLASFAGHHLTPSWCPLVFFTIAATMSTLMGTAWGTMGMLFPLCLPLLVGATGLATPVGFCQLPMLSASIGAIISGALIGNHLSPISDIMFITSKSVGAYHMDVVKNQMGLTIPTLISSTLAFALLGLGWSSLLALGSGLLLNLVLINVLAARAK